MAGTVSFQPFEFNETCIKPLAADSSNFKVPSKFNFTNDPSALTSDSIPVVDFSALASSDPGKRSVAIHNLTEACQEWGFFVLVNHGIAEELMDAMLTATKQFFSLPAGERKRYEAKSALDPIQCGNFSVEDAADSNRTITLWRDYLKLHVHPEFHCPHQPQLLREVLVEYSEKIRKLARNLLRAVSEVLELEEGDVDEVLKMESSFQLFAANFYPVCPQPDQAIGIPPHTDSGLLTFLIHNGVAGLQIEHHGKWFNTDSPPNSLFVNVADQLQIFTNGRCKSVRHRAVVNSERERISILLSTAPALEAVVGPAPCLVQRDGCPLYLPMKYMEYIETQLTKSRINGKTILEQMMIRDDQVAN